MVIDTQRRAAPLLRLSGGQIRALVVDDEKALTDLLSMALRAEGWQTRVASEGHAALAVAREFSPDVIVLDVMMPGIDGLEVLRRLRDNGNDSPVLFLTAKDDVNDRLLGITGGGDDYVVKPFSLEEVVARLRGLVRRHIRLVEKYQPTLQIDDLLLNEETYEVQRADAWIDLTPTEFRVLRYMMGNPRRVLSRAQILDVVWGDDFGGRSGIVEIYVSQLRKKLHAVGPPLIHTVRGVGYAIRPNSHDA